MRQETFPRRFAGHAVTALILALCLVPINSSPVAALSISDYFSYSYNVEFSQTEIDEGEAFNATVTAEATCTTSLPITPSQSQITSRMIAEHETSGVRVTLNSSYSVTISPFPGQAGQSTQVIKVVPLEFPSGSAAGTYNVFGEIIEVKLQVPIIGWMDVTTYFPSSQILGSVTYLSGSVSVSPRPGGGGGSGGLLPIQYRSARDGTVTDGTINTVGEVRGTFRAASTDGKVIATLSVGSYAKDKKGAPLGYLTMTVDKEPPQPPPGAIINGPPLPPPNIIIMGTAYNFKPDGATFEPPMTVVWSYDPEALPEGVLEGELHVAWWDGSKWQPLESIVNTEDNTVSAAVAHFTTFAIFVTLPPTPAAFTLSSLSASPAKVDIGESVTVSVLVTNNNESSGTQQVILRIDDAVVSTKEITLEGGATQEVIFTTTKDAAGIYSVTVGGLSGSFVVGEPAAFVASDLSITPAKVAIGEGVTISALITNTSDAASSYKVTFKIDDVVVTTKEVTLKGGAAQEVTFTTTPDIAKTYAVTVDGVRGEFIVKSPPAFIVSNLLITPAEVEASKEVTISILVTNTGDTGGSYEVTLMINGELVSTRWVQLAGGSNEKATFTTTRDVAGTHIVSVNGLNGTLAVRAQSPKSILPGQINWWLVIALSTAVVILVPVVLIVRRSKRLTAL